MSFAVVVNPLVHAVNADSPHQPRAEAFLQWAVGSGRMVHLYWPVLAGFLRISTHPGIHERPLPLPVALEVVDRLVARPTVRTSGGSVGLWPQLREAVGEVGSGGNAVSDAFIVSLMHDTGVTTIWTQDRDFRRFDGITVKDPFADRYATGFR